MFTRHSVCYYAHGVYFGSTDHRIFVLMLSEFFKCCFTISRLLLPSNHYPSDGVFLKCFSYCQVFLSLQKTSEVLLPGALLLPLDRTFLSSLKKTARLHSLVHTCVYTFICTQILFLNYLLFNLPPLTSNQVPNYFQQTHWINNHNLD